NRLGAALAFEGRSALRRADMTQQLQYEAKPPPPRRKVAIARLAISIALNVLLIGIGSWFYVTASLVPRWLGVAIIIMAAASLVPQAVWLARIWRLHRAVGNNTPAQVAQRILDRQRA